MGVDINRNYDLAFGFDNTGSSNNPCGEDYRGSAPFSEKETQAIKNFLETHRDVKIALNMHSYGNLLIHPFNYLNFRNERFKKHSLYPNYERFILEAAVPQSYLIGNGPATVRYMANGEATDWMLAAMNLLTFSPELCDVNTFFPTQSEVLKCVKENFPWMM